MIVIFFHVLRLLGKLIYGSQNKSENGNAEGAGKNAESCCSEAKILGTEKELFTDFYDEDEPIRFSPPAYLQRYRAVAQILEGRYAGEIQKVVDFGCSELGFFTHLKNTRGVEEILCVDVDRATLEQHEKKIEPLTLDYLGTRAAPLVVRVFEGSVTDNDESLQDTDAVVCIELIEHLYPQACMDLPYNIFGYVQPKVAIFTTPNADFNVLFKGMTGFRHWDHKFEWTRQQFQNWASNIVMRYPSYSVEFVGICSGPPGTENLGHCSQMAVFHRNLPKVTCQGKSGLFKSVRFLEYPFTPDTRTLAEKTLQEAVYYIRRYSFASDDEVMPLELLAKWINTVSSSVLQEIIEKDGWKVTNGPEGPSVVIPPLSEYSASDLNDLNYSDEDIYNQWDQSDPPVCQDWPEIHDQDEDNWDEDEDQDRYQNEDHARYHDEDQDDDHGRWQNENPVRSKNEDQGEDHDRCHNEDQMQNEDHNRHQNEDHDRYQNEDQYENEDRYLNENQSQNENGEEKRWLSEDQNQRESNEDPTCCEDRDEDLGINDECQAQSGVPTEDQFRHRHANEDQRQNEDHNHETTLDSICSIYLQSSKCENDQIAPENISNPEFQLSKDYSNIEEHRGSPQLTSTPVKTTDKKVDKNFGSSGQVDGSGEVEEINLSGPAGSSGPLRSNGFGRAFRFQKSCDSPGTLDDLHELEKCGNVGKSDEKFESTIWGKSGSSGEIDGHSFQGKYEDFLEMLDSNEGFGGRLRLKDDSVSRSGTEADTEFESFSTRADFKSFNPEEFSGSCSNGNSGTLVLGESSDQFHSLQKTISVDNLEIFQVINGGLEDDLKVDLKSSRPSPPISWSPEIMDSGYPNTSSAHSAHDDTPEGDLSSIGHDRISDSESPSLAEGPRPFFGVENGDLANNNRDDEGNNVMMNLEDLGPLIDDLENENDIYDFRNGFPVWLLGILEGERAGGNRDEGFLEDVDENENVDD